MTSSTSLAGQFFELAPVKRLERWLNAMPHPALVVEIASTHVAAAHWSKTGRHLESHAIEPLPLGAVMASPVDTNVVQPDAVRSALRKVFNRVPAHGSPLALLIPDPVVRVFILPFDTLPRRADEALPLLRWRLKKSVPFDVDETVVSWMRQNRPRGGSRSRHRRRAPAHHSRIRRHPAALGRQRRRGAQLHSGRAAATRQTKAPRFWCASAARR